MSNSAAAIPATPALVLTHRVDGEGSPLLLLNGGFMSIAAWDPFVSILSANQRVIRCDFRGQLLSRGPYPASLTQHAGDVVELLDALQIASVHVAGVSFGAEIAMLVAARAPERVHRLTVISATDRVDSRMQTEIREGRQLAEQAAAGDREAGQTLFRRVLHQTWSESWLARQPAGFIEARVQQAALLPPLFFEGAAAILAAMDTLDLTPELGRITSPTLVVIGEHDRVFPPAHAQAIAAGIAHARLEIIPDTGHGLLFEHAKRIVELLAP